MTNNDIDLAAQVAELTRERDARRAAEAARLSANPNPLPPKQQWQVELEESQGDSKRRGIEDHARQQAIIYASIARNAPEVKKLDAKVAAIRTEITDLESKITERREAIDALGASYPPVEGLRHPVTPAMPSAPVSRRRVGRERVR